ncbi:hypothetical protein SAMN05421863_11182 [Nitrosomonas communis]|jgi:hypothetical protein|uniref:Uncharacterized protein n=1 Tax=Nitrosomonas communis TaxID=44574 RepID=A0A1I4WRI6_9PROT|nr:hypothetical protein SAMN05421863_11182 [Nitrosomonas communis]
MELATEQEEVTQKNRSDLFFDQRRNIRAYGKEA